MQKSRFGVPSSRFWTPGDRFLTVFLPSRGVGRGVSTTRPQTEMHLQSVSA